MNKLKTLVTGAALAGAVVATKAQQTLQKVTQGSNETIVELFQIRNGSSNSNVVGVNGYNQDLSQGAGTQIAYLESTGSAYTSNANGSLPLGSFPAEQIGNGTFEIATTPYTNNKASTRYNWNNNGTLMPGGQLTINTYNTDRDAIEDGNTNADLLHSKWVLPHTFDNGDPLPVGIHMILMSRDGYKDTGGTHASKRIGFKWNGSAWVQQTVDPAGSPYDNLQNATLGVQDVENSKKKGVAYPNPTSDNIYLNDGDNTTNESFGYTIYDSTGRQIGKGNAREDQPISIGKTSNGMYIINTQDTDGDITSHRVIKK